MSHPTTCPCHTNLTPMNGSMGGSTCCDLLVPLTPTPGDSDTSARCVCHVHAVVLSFTIDQDFPGPAMSSFVAGPLGDRSTPLGVQQPGTPPGPGRDKPPCTDDFPEAILAMLCFVITQLFRVETRSVPDPLDDTLPLLSEDPSHLEHLPHLSGVQHVTITAIRATGLTLGLQRIPAGFHVTVQADGAEWQTSNKSVNVDQNVVEWDERILLSHEPSSKVQVSAYVSFELDLMLGHGELLRTFEISVGELLDRSGKSHSVVFQPKTGEVVSSCTSLFMTVEQRRSDQRETSVLRPLTPLTSGDMQTLILKTDAGHRLLARYRRMQNSRDLDQSIKHFECASDLCPVDHSCHPAALCNLANAKFVSCQVNGTYLDLDLDLDIPISLLQDAINVRPTDHPDRPVTQLQLAIALLTRFAKRGFKTDADTAQELLNEVLHVCHANSHVYRSALLAVETCALCPLHSAGSVNANNIGREWPVASMLPISPNELCRRVNICFECDDPHDLDNVISLYYNALEYYSTAHAVRGKLRCGLGSVLSTRFERRINSQDFDKVMALHRESLALHPIGHPHRAESLIGLGYTVFARFEQGGSDQELDEAIALDREALDLHPVAISARFKYSGNSRDFDEAIVLEREALAVCPAGHPARSMSLNNLACSLCIRFTHRGNHQDPSHFTALRPVGDPQRSMSLINLATALSTRFEHRGSDQDLDEAITLDRKALALHPVGRMHWSISSNNLAHHLTTRFEHRGNDQDLDEAIVLRRGALALLPVGHPERSTSESLNHLANVLSAGFKHHGSKDDLDDAIVLLREALVLHPVGHPSRSISLGNLSNELSIRFQHRGNVKDSDEVITPRKEVLALRAVGHSDRYLALINLANSYIYEGKYQDLDEAVTLLTEALALNPGGPLCQAVSSSNLGGALAKRSRDRDNDHDLGEAIAFNKKALSLRPVSNTDRSVSLHNLATSLSTRFERQGNAQDLNESLENLRCALALFTQHDPFQLSVHRSLATVYLLFHQSGLDSTGEDADSLNAAMRHLKAAAKGCLGRFTISRASKSIRWVRHADQFTHGTELEAYATSIQLLDAYMSATASVSSRHDIMKDFPSTLAVDAGSCALRLGDVCHAVELLEQGRTLIWTQERGDHAQALMKKFRHLSSLLDKPPTNYSEETPRVDVEAVMRSARNARAVTCLPECVDMELAWCTTQMPSSAVRASRRLFS
ncbi:hypothetical protein DFH29DRAFT_1021985 [Suillus ampliporus]|nr:hypothetical protein DFH29DRAFT_1021985 [Suillus ampliporus]